MLGLQAQGLFDDGRWSLEVIHVTYPTLEVSPNTAVGTRGSLGTAGGNTARKHIKISDLLKHRWGQLRQITNSGKTLLFSSFFFLIAVMYEFYIYAVLFSLWAVVNWLIDRTLTSNDLDMTLVHHLSLFPGKTKCRLDPCLANKWLIIFLLIVIKVTIE